MLRGTIARENVDETEPALSSNMVFCLFKFQSLYHQSLACSLQCQFYVTCHSNLFELVELSVFVLPMRCCLSLRKLLLYRA